MRIIKSLSVKQHLEDSGCIFKDERVDWGKISSSDTVTAYCPNEQALVYAAAFAAKARIPFVVRGKGLSPGRLCSSGKGIVLVPLDSRIEQIGPTTFQCGPAVSCAQIQEYLSSKGMSLPVMHGAPGATLAGSVLLGGYGPNSLRKGGQYQWITTFKVAKGDGTVLIVNRSSDFALWRAIPCSLGTLGPVTALHVEACNAPCNMAIIEVVFADVSNCLSFALSLVANSSVKSLAMRVLNTEHATLRIVTDSSYKYQVWDEALALHAVVSFGAEDTIVSGGKLAPAGHWRHYVIPQHTNTILAKILLNTMIDLDKCGVNGRLVILFSDGNAAILDEPYLSPVALNTPSIGVGLHLDSREADIGQAIQDRFRGRCIEAGGRPYAAAVLESSPRELQHFFGLGLEHWKTWKRCFDPHTLIHRRISKALLA